MGTGVHLIKLSIRSKASVLRRRPKFSVPTLSENATFRANLLVEIIAPRRFDLAMYLVKKIARAQEHRKNTDERSDSSIARRPPVEKFDANEAKVRRRFSATHDNRKLLVSRRPTRGIKCFPCRHENDSSETRVRRRTWRVPRVLAVSAGVSPRTERVKGERGGGARGRELGVITVGNCMPP